MMTPAATPSAGRAWSRLKSALFARGLRRAQRAVVRFDRRVVGDALGRIGASEATEIPSWTTERELHALFALAAACPPGARALEIGSYLGASTCYLAAGLRTRAGHLYCVDTLDNETMPEGPRDTLALFDTNTHGFAHMITRVRKRSELLSADDVETPLDLVFIDGDHAYDAVRADFERVSEWLAPDGVVAFHDVGAAEHPGVSSVVGEAIASGRWAPAGVAESLVWLRRPYHARVVSESKHG
jgi:predicted O-methyltransferase YrrM